MQEKTGLDAVHVLSLEYKFIKHNLKEFMTFFLIAAGSMALLNLIGLSFIGLIFFLVSGTRLARTGGFSRSCDSKQVRLVAAFCDRLALDSFASNSSSLQSVSPSLCPPKLTPLSARAVIIIKMKTNSRVSFSIQ